MQGCYRRVGHEIIAVIEQEQLIELGVLVEGWWTVLPITQQERQALILNSEKAAEQVEQLLRAQVEVPVPEGFGF